MYRTTEVGNADALSAAAGEVHRRLVRLRLQIMLPALMLALGAGAAGFATGLALPVPQGLHVPIGTSGGYAPYARDGIFALAPFFGILGTGWLLYRWSSRRARRGWLEELAQRYALPVEELGEVTRFFFEPRAKTPNIRRLLVMMGAGLIAAVMLLALALLMLGPPP